MTAGLSGANLAKPWLDVLALSGITAKTVIAVKLHIGDPGPSGTANVSSVTTRSTITFAAANTSGAIASNNTPSWANWAGTSPETVSYISLWDSTTAGNFLCSIAITGGGKVMSSNDTLNLTSGGTTVSLTPIAA